MGTVGHELGTHHRIGLSSLLATIIVVALLGGCAAIGARDGSQDGPAGERLGEGLMGPARRDAYGPGIHADGTGRLFEWRTRDGQVERGKVKRNAYGLGVGMDASGRPVTATPR